MSEKSRLESCEKQLVAQNRAIKAIVASLDEAEKVFASQDDQIEQLYNSIDRLTEKVDSLFECIQREQEPQLSDS